MKPKKPLLNLSIESYTESLIPTGTLSLMELKIPLVWGQKITLKDIFDFSINGEIFLNKAKLNRPLNYRISVREEGKLYVTELQPVLFAIKDTCEKL